VGYSAPELAAAEPGHGFAADVWSFGAVVYVLLCGCHPFDAGDDDRAVVAARVARGEVLPMDGSAAAAVEGAVGRRWEGVSDAARDFVAACLVVDAGARATVEGCLAHAWLAGDAPDVAALTGALARLRVYRSSRRELRQLRRQARPSPSPTPIPPLPPARPVRDVPAGAKLRADGESQPGAPSVHVAV
jgi:serine/threonine protein kinase